jgi:hypothetical protein
MDSIQVDMVMMNKEEPNTQLFFNNTIARVVFEEDKERKIYWLDFKDFPAIHRYLYLYQLHLLHYYLLHLHIPIEEWRIENNFPTHPSDWTTEQWTQFKSRWV